MISFLSVIRYGEFWGMVYSNMVKVPGYVWLGDEKVHVRARVEQLSGYFAYAVHADRNSTFDWVGSMSEQPGNIKLVHGDDSARHALRDELELQGHNAEA